MRPLAEHTQGEQLARKARESWLKEVSPETRKTKSDEDNCVACRRSYLSELNPLKFIYETDVTLPESTYGARALVFQSPKSRKKVRFSIRIR